MNKPEKKIDWEAKRNTFFQTVNASLLMDDAFTESVRKLDPKQTDETIARARGYWHQDDAGNISIFVRIGEEGMPEEYVPYVLEHERWEAWVGTKAGYNLERVAIRKLLDSLKGKFAPEGGQISISRETLRAVRGRYLDEYVFDYKHEFAIWKEYQMAEREGNLDAYHAFVMNMRREDLENFQDTRSVGRTNNDIKIRESIYEKIRDGKQHRFLGLESE